MKWLSVEEYPAPPRHLWGQRLPVRLAAEGGGVLFHTATFGAIVDAPRWMWFFPPIFGYGETAKVDAWLNTDKAEDIEIFDENNP